MRRILVPIVFVLTVLGVAAIPADAHHRPDHASGGGKPSPSPSASPSPSDEPITYCNVVTDPAGDATAASWWHPRELPPSQSLDLLGGDVASDDNYITTVMKVAADPRVIEADKPWVRIFRYGLMIASGGDRRFEMEAVYSQSGANYVWRDLTGGNRRPGESRQTYGYYDPEEGEIHMSVRIADLKESFAWMGSAYVESYLSTLQLWGAHIPDMGYAGLPDDVDRATGDQYQLQAPSCTAVEPVP